MVSKPPSQSFLPTDITDGPVVFDALDAAPCTLTEGDGLRNVTRSFGYDVASHLTSWSEGAGTQDWIPRTLRTVLNSRRV